MLIHLFLEHDMRLMQGCYISSENMTRFWCYVGTSLPRTWHSFDATLLHRFREHDKLLMLRWYISSQNIRRSWCYVGTSQLVWGHLKITIFNVFSNGIQGWRLKTLFLRHGQAHRQKIASWIPHSRMAQKTSGKNQCCIWITGGYEPWT